MRKQFEWNVRRGMRWGVVGPDGIWLSYTQVKKFLAKEHDEDVCEQRVSYCDTCRPRIIEYWRDIISWTLRN